MNKPSNDVRICIWCQGEIEHSFTIPLCVPCLVRIHNETTARDFDHNKPLQAYLTAARGKTLAEKKPFS